MEDKRMFEMKGEDRTPLSTDPKLKEAMAEINAVMSKHDIGGHIILVSKSHSEFKFFLEPTWSVARWENEGIRIKAQKADLGSKEAVMEALGLTAHLILQIHDLAVRDAKICKQIAVELAKHCDIEHNPYQGFVPQREN